MKANKILYPTDFSANGNAALDLASALAAETGATLYIVHVDDTTPALLPANVGYGYVPAIDAIAQEELKLLQEVVPTRDEVAIQRRFLRGAAAEQILDFAQREEVDLILLGTHGRTGLARLLMGSVAEAVLRGATCPVLTVRQPSMTPTTAAASLTPEASRSKQSRHQASEQVQANRCRETTLRRYPSTLSGEAPRSAMVPL